MRDVVDAVPYDEQSPVPPCGTGLLPRWERIAASLRASQ